MKKNVLKTLSLGLLSTAILMASSSCNKKDEMARVAPIKTVDEQEVLSTPPPGWGLNNTLNMSTYDCATPATDCFDEIVVKPQTMNAVNELYTAIAAGVSETVDFFTTGDYDVVFPGLGGTYLAKLQDGQHHIEVHASTTTGGKDALLVFENGETEHDFVLVIQH